MRKLGIAVLGAGLLGVIGWGAFWYVGKGRVDARIDAEVAVLESQGWTVTIGRREVGGFPSGYRVELGDIGVVDTASGALIRVPRADVDLSLEGGPARVTLGDGVRVDLPVGQALRLDDPTLPTVMRLKLTADTLIVEAPEEGVLVVNAPEARLAMDQDDYHGKFQLVASGIEARLDRSAPRVGVGLSAAEMRFDASTAAPGEAPVAVALNGQDAVWKAAYSPPLGGLLDRLATGQGAESAELDYRFGDLTLGVSVDASASGGLTGSVGAKGRDAVGRIEIALGALRLDAQSEDVHWSFEPDGGGLALGGGVSIAFGKVSQVLPLQASEEALDAPTRLVLDGVMPDETLWQALDPDGVLDRRPAALSMDAVMRTKVRQTIPAGSTRPQIRYEPTNLTLDALSLTALGGEVSAAGDVDILQPIMVPLGEIAIQGRGLVGLAGALERARLIGAEQRQMFDAILQVYARPGDGIDSWETEIGFGTEGISVNGLPVQ